MRNIYFTMAFSNRITRNLSITILLLILMSFSSIHAIDCGGKPFHCENTTHFKICVDFGNGVSSTVDDFVIPCPPGTECRGKNHFECEFLPATTPAAIALLSDVTNDTKVLDTSATTPLMWEVVTTNLPPRSLHDKEFSERYLNTEKPLIGDHLPKLTTDSGQLANDTGVIITTNFPETLTGTTVHIVPLENITDEIINVTSPESLDTLFANKHIVATVSPVAVIPLTGGAVNETVHEYHVADASVSETSTTVPEELNTFMVIKEKTVQELQVTDVSVSETSTAMPKELNKFMVIKTTASLMSTHEAAPVTEDSVMIQHEKNENVTYQVEIITSTPNLDQLSTSAVNNGGEGITNVTVRKNPSKDAFFNKTVQNQAILNKISELGEVVVVTTVTPAQLNTLAMDNIPEELGTVELAATEIAETISNKEISEIASYESLIDDTTVAQAILGTSFGANTGLEVITSAPTTAEPFENVYVTDESMSMMSTLTPVIFNASKVDNFETIIPIELSKHNVFDNKVTETVRNQKPTEKNANIEDVFVTTAPAQEITYAPSEFKNGQQLLNGSLPKNILISKEVQEEVNEISSKKGTVTDGILFVATKGKPQLVKSSQTIDEEKDLISNNFIDNFTPEVTTASEIIETTERDATPVEAHLSGVFDNMLMATESTATININPIKKSNEINMDTTTQTKISISDVTTEFLDVVTRRDAVPVEAYIFGAFDNILNNTESTTAMTKSQIKKGEEILDITTESQIPMSDVTTQIQDIVTHTQPILRDTTAEESIFITDSSNITKHSDSIAPEDTENTVGNIELTTLTGPNYEIVPLIETFTKHKTQETTASAPEFSQIIFEGTGYQQEGINANEGWLILKDVETTTDNMIIKETKGSIMTKSSVMSKSETSTALPLPNENNKVTTGLFENLAVTLMNIGNEVNDNNIMPSNKRFTVKNTQEKEGAAATEKLDSTSWDPSDGLLMNMPNVVFELDKNTDSISSDFVTDADTGIGIDETSYVGQQYKKTDAYPILSETIPDTVINQVPTSEYVIETNQNPVESTKTESNLVADVTMESVTKVLSQIASTENNTNTIGYEPTTESVTVPIKGTNEDFEQNNNAYFVTNQNFNALASKTDEIEQSTPAGTSGVLSNVESSLIDHSNRRKYVGLDSSSVPETEVQTESQIAQNQNSVITTYFQTASDASSAPTKQPNFYAQPKRTTVATKSVSNNIKDLKTVSTEYLEHTVTSRTSSSETYNTLETVKWGLTDHSPHIGANKEELMNYNGKEIIRTMSMTIENTTPMSSTKTSPVNLNMVSASQRDKTESNDDIYTDARYSVHPIIKNITNTDHMTNNRLTKITTSLPFNHEETAVKGTTLETSYNTMTLESSINEKKQVVGEIRSNEHTGDGQAPPKIPNEISLATGLPSKTYLIETVFDTETTNVDKTLVSEVPTVTAEGLKSPAQIIKDTLVEKEEEYTKSPPNISKEMTKPFLAGTTILPNVQTTKISKSFTQSMTHMETTSTTHESDINNDSNANREVSKLFSISTLIPSSLESSFANTQATVKNPKSVSTTETIIIDKSVPAMDTVTTTTKADENKNISVPVTTVAALGYDCSTVVRGRFSDKFDCRKFYICIDKHAIVGFCPGNAVFSPIKKQCTKNLAHCLRDGEFQCTSQGRFADIQRKNIYYICVKNGPAFVRFQFQCQDGFILNKSAIRCEKFVERDVTPSWLDVLDKKSLQSHDVTKKALEKKVPKPKTNQSDVSNKDSEQSSSDVSKKEKNPASNESPEPKEEVEEKRKSIKCISVGKIPHPENCRKYYVCYKNKKSELRRKRKKCDSDEVFDKNKSKCVDSESYECNLG